MKISIVFFGITRSLSTTINSIKKNIIQPAEKFGDVSIICHFFEQQSISNDRSGEFGVLDPDEYKLLNPDWVKFEKPNECLEIWGFEHIKKQGDAWHDGFKSLRNLIHQLHSLRCVTEQAILQDAEIVLFCRPDLLYHDSFEKTIKKFTEIKSDTVGIPFWQWHGGLNDRFSICVGKNAIKSYGQRIEKIGDYLIKTKSPLHSENLLRHTLTSTGVHYRPIFLNASRVRVGGAIKKESFSYIRNMGWKQIISKNLNL